MRKNKIKKDESIIPIGPYCYSHDGTRQHSIYGEIPKLKMCPYRTYKWCNGVCIHWCDFLNVGDYMSNSSFKESKSTYVKSMKKLAQHFRSTKKRDAILRDGWLLFDDCKICGVNDPDGCPQCQCITCICKENK